MSISAAEIRRQYERVKRAGWLPWFQEAARRADTSTAHFLGFGSRETNLKNIRGDHRGGIWHGYGVVQVDIGTDPEYAKAWTPDNVEPGIVRGSEIFGSKVDQIINGQGKRLTVKGHKFVGKTCEPDDIRRIATASYNCGLWSYFHFSRGEKADSTTTGHDYSRDVYDRSIEFADLLDKDGTEPGALRREIELQGKYAKASARARAGVAQTPDVHLPLADPLEEQSQLLRADYHQGEDAPDETVKAVVTPEAEAKGVTTGAPGEKTEGATTPAPAVEIQASQVSLQTKVIAIGTMVAGFVAKVGLDLKQTAAGAAGFAHDNRQTTLFLLTIVCIGAFLLWSAQQRAHRRTEKIIDAAAAQDKNNVRLV